MFNLKSNLSRKQMSIITPTSVLDSDLEIMRGPCHPDPKIRGWGRGGAVSKIFFGPFGPQFGLKMGGGGWAPRAPPLGPPLNIGRSGGEHYTVGVLVQKFAFSESVLTKY